MAQVEAVLEIVVVEGEEVPFLQVVEVVVVWAEDLKEAEGVLVPAILILVPFSRVIGYLEMELVV